MTIPDRAALVLSLSDEDAGALTAYGEDRGGTIMGLVAVLCVIRTRASIGKWGNTWPAVCLAREQFSCWNDGDPNQGKLVALAAALNGTQLPIDPVFDVCRLLAREVANGAYRDPTGGATHYYSPGGMAHAPAWSMPPAERTTIIGGNAFYRNVRF